MTCGQPSASVFDAGGRSRILDTLGEKGAEALSEILDGMLPPSQWHSPLWKQRFWFTNPVMVRFFNWALGVSKGIA